jgi:hypothetical protein
VTQYNTKYYGSINVCVLACARVCGNKSPITTISINVPSIATEMFFIYYSQYISHFSMVLSILQGIPCFCDFVVVYASGANQSILFFS